MRPVIYLLVQNRAAFSRCSFFNDGEIFPLHLAPFFQELFSPALAVLVFYQQEQGLVWADCFLLLNHGLLDVRAY